MKQILFIFERDMPTVSIMRGQYANISAKYNLCTTFRYLLDVTSEDIEKHDVVIMIRPNDILSWRIAQKAREAGRVIFVFCDDDLLNLPNTLATIPWRKQGLRKALQMADGILSSNRYICEHYAPLTANKRGVVFDSPIFQEDIMQAERLLDREDTAPVRIVYAASPGHVPLFDRYVRPVMQDLTDRYGKSIEFTFVSVRPDLSEFAEKTNIHYVKGMPLAEYREYMVREHFDIGLAPLSDDSFSKCKYFNKFLEYTMCGVVGVYSKVEPYTYVVRDRENGFLPENDAQSWYEALCRAIDNVPLRRACLRGAVDTLKNDFLEERITEKLFLGIPELCTYDAPQKRIHLNHLLYKALYYLSRPLDWVYLSLFELKSNGFSGLCRKVKMHMREAGAYRRKKK